MTHPKIMIITLYCGESGYKNCINSVKTQNYDGKIDHIFIENLPNIEAHKACYQTIMDQSNNYDLFIKLDADMVFTSTTALTDTVNFWTKNNNPDHMVFAVHDDLSDQNIIGIHVFSKNCTWDITTHDPLFVDPNPHYNGQHIKTYNAPAPFVSHLAHPTDAEAYQYGVHRAAKAFQWGRWNADIRGLGALRTLLDVADHYKRTGDKNALKALQGAEDIRTHTIAIHTGDKAPHNIADLSIDFWLSPLRVKLYWGLMVAPRIMPSYLWAKMMRIIHQKRAMPCEYARRL